MHIEVVLQQKACGISVLFLFLFAKRDVVTEVILPLLSNILWQQKAD